MMEQSTLKNMVGLISLCCLDNKFLQSLDFLFNYGYNKNIKS